MIFLIVAIITLEDQRDIWFSLLFGPFGKNKNKKKNIEY